MKKNLPRGKLLVRAELMLREEALPYDEVIWLKKKSDLLQQAIQDRVTDHVLQNRLKEVGNSVVRRNAYAILMGQSTDASGLRDGWMLATIANRVDEQLLFFHMKRSGTLSEVGEERSLSPLDSWQFSQAVWGQYSAGLESQAEEGLRALKLFEIRGQTDLPDEFAGLPVAINHLLRAAAPESADFDRFEQVTPFKGLALIWEDDQKFKSMLSEACDWHLGMLYPADFYYAGIGLFPAWLFALDCYRQKQLGRSCLPDHPLIAYGRRLLEADFSGPIHPLVTAAEDEYARRYADKLVDFEAEWRAFLKN